MKARCTVCGQVKPLSAQQRHEDVFFFTRQLTTLKQQHSKKKHQNLRNVIQYDGVNFCFGPMLNYTQTIYSSPSAFLWPLLLTCQVTRGVGQAAAAIERARRTPSPRRSDGAVARGRRSRSPRCRRSGSRGKRRPDPRNSRKRRLGSLKEFGWEMDVYFFLVLLVGGDAKQCFGMFVLMEGCLKVWCSKAGDLWWSHRRNVRQGLC